MKIKINNKEYHLYEITVKNRTLFEISKIISPKGIVTIRLEGSITTMPIYENTYAIQYFLLSKEPLLKKPIIATIKDLSSRPYIPKIIFRDFISNTKFRKNNLKIITWGAQDELGESGMIELRRTIYNIVIDVL